MKLTSLFSFFIFLKGGSFNYYFCLINYFFPYLLLISRDFAISSFSLLYLDLNATYFGKISWSNKVSSLQNPDYLLDVIELNILLIGLV